jgi:aspartate aminotransferase
MRSGRFLAKDKIHSTEQGISISQRGIRIQDSPIRKLASIAETRKTHGIKVYHLNIGQPDLPTPAAVYESLRNLPQSTIAYAPSNGLPEAIAAWRKYLASYGIRFGENEMIVTTGGSEAIIFAMLAVCDVDDEIIVFEPFYTNYNGFASIANVKLRPVPLRIANGFHLPPETDIERSITARTRAILFCSPSNPTGAIYSGEELQRLVRLSIKHNLFLLSDEVYREFAYDAKVTSICDFPEIQDRAILLDSCSKRFNVCGARIGLLASHNKEIIASVLKFGMARLSVASVEQLALVPLLENPTKYTGPIVEEFRLRRDTVIGELETIPGVTFYKPEGAFYIIIGLPVKDSEHFSKWLIEEYEHNGETVLLAPGAGFYATPSKGRNEARLAFMLCADDLKRSLQILKMALETYKQKFPPPEV